MHNYDVNIVRNPNYTNLFSVFFKPQFFSGCIVDHLTQGVKGIILY